MARLSEPELADIRSRRIGFVFQNFNLLARTSALENVVLPLLYGAAAALTSSERNDRGRDMLAGVGLADRERNTPSQLSGGQQQRVALARALINQPAVLLADEPTGNLDTRTSHEIMDIIRKLNREQGVTVILVTHEADIGAYADRMIVMRDGKIVSDERQAAGREPDPADAAHAPTRRRRGRGHRAAPRRRIRRARGLPVDDRLGVAAGAGAQQAALGPDHAGRVHRRGGADRHGRRRRRRQRGGEEAAGKPGHQHGGGPARRHDRRRRARRAPAAPRP